MRAASPAMRSARAPISPAHSSGATSASRVGAGQRQAEARVGDRALGEAAVGMKTGEARPRAEVLAPRAAELALAAGPAEPRHADAVARAQAGALAAAQHAPDDLVAEDQRQARRGELTVTDVDVGPAGAARQDLEQHVVGTRFGLRDLRHAQRAARLIQQRGTHGPIF